MINFRGNYICDLNINKKQADGSFTPETSRLAEISADNIKDIEALGLAVRKWKGTSRVAANIVDNMRGVYYFADNYNIGSASDYYIATSQENNFADIVPEKIQGVIEVENKINNKKIEYFEVKPEYNFNNPNREYSGIGHSIMDAIKKIYKDSDFIVHPLKTAIKFYEKEGFTKISETNPFYILKRK